MKKIIIHGLIAYDEVEEVIIETLWAETSPILAKGNIVRLSRPHRNNSKIGVVKFMDSWTPDGLDLKACATLNASTDYICPTKVYEKSEVTRTEMERELNETKEHPGICKLAIENGTVAITLPTKGS